MFFSVRVRQVLMIVTLGVVAIVFGLALSNRMWEQAGVAAWFLGAMWWTGLWRIDRAHEKRSPSKAQQLLIGALIASGVIGYQLTQTQTLLSLVSAALLVLHWVWF